MRRPITVAVAALAALNAACSSGGVAEVVGVPQLISMGQAVSELTVDFGPTLLATQVERDILIRNAGIGAFTITGVTTSPGFSPDFSVASAEAGVRVEPNAETGVHVSFHPSEAGTVSGTIYLAISNGDRAKLAVQLVGRGVRGNCTLSSPSLEFGRTSVGATYPMQVVVQNEDVLPWQVRVAPLDPSAPFAFGGGFGPGVYMVPASNKDGSPGHLVVPVEFHPTRVGVFSTDLVLDSPDCPSSVPLHGLGVEHMLECSPQVESGGVQVCRVDFGFVHPGGKGVRPVTFRNMGDFDLHLVLGQSDDDAFGVALAEREFTIPAGGAPISIDLTFQPTEVGQVAAKLSFTSDDSGAAAGFVDLAGIGGGPQIAAAPAALDFGRLAIGTYQTRIVSITNIGSELAGLDDELLLATRDATGAWVETRAEITGVDAAAFSVEWPPVGYGGSGLHTGVNAELRVKFAPIVDGPRAATLTIYSNDLSAPQVTIPLTGVGVRLPPCDYSVSSQNLDFGVVDPNSYLTLDITITNRDPTPENECLVAMVDLTPDTARVGAFVLPEGAIESATLRGGTSLIVPIRFAPKVAGSYSGELAFFVSHPTAPEVRVSLTGYGRASCLMVAPREFDFGTLGIACKSLQRAFTVYNTCTAPITLTSVALLSGASADFSITRRPALPLTLSGGASAEYGVTYFPFSAGNDAGAVTLATNDGSVYVARLNGRAAVNPVQTDVFTQGQQPKVDVLFVVDDSCSMQDKQASLARNFSSFIHDADSNGVDYHIAATTVSLDGSSFACGRFVPLTGSNPRVITPSTPNRAQVFSQNVQIGTGGTGTESLIRPAYLALSNPLISGHNAGFYRDEAKLAIVVFSDAADQDPLSTPMSFYENFFVNLKGAARRNDFTVSGILPTMATEPPYSSGCSYDSSDAGQDMRVRQLISHTGGFVDEICNPDWSHALSALGQRIFGQRITVFLTSMPDMTQTDPITITVDGQPFPQYGAAGGVAQWEYKSASNAIEFDPSAAPAPGSSISVSYPVACLR